MPFQLQWIPDSPVLLCSYSGTLTAKEYYALCDQRQKLIDKGPEHVIVIADTQHLESFAESALVKLCASIFECAQVGFLLIVLNPTLYQNLSRALSEPDDRLQRVYFFASQEAAIAHAEKLAEVWG